MRTALAASALAAAGCASLLVGSTDVPWSALADPASPDHAVAAARLARTWVAVAAGAALGLAGACLQGLTRNPLADPGILGTNAGAAFAMVVAITWLGVSDLTGYVWFAFLGAAATSLLVHQVAGTRRAGASPATLVVTGAAATAALTSWTSAVLLTDRRTLETFRAWQVGTVGGRGYEVLVPLLPFLLVGAAAAVLGARALDSLSLGDDLATGLGRGPVRDQVVLGAAVVLLSGAATALAGPIGFVGLAVPHLVRATAGGAHGSLLPLSAVWGAALTVLADTAGRVVLPPTEVQVGIMTAVVGAPVLLVLLRRTRVAA